MSKIIFEYESTCSRNDNSWCCETLKKNKNGDLVLVGTGGLLTQWAKINTDLSLGFGRGRRKISRAEAIDWLTWRAKIDRDEAAKKIDNC